MSTYTQTQGTKLGNKYFMDVEISPVTLHDGSLRQRFDTHLYPELGDVVVEDRGLRAIGLTTSNASPVQQRAFTLTATVTAHEKDSSIIAGPVVFKDATTTLGTVNVTNVNGVATAVLVIAAGVAPGVHPITATYAGRVSSTVVVTASADSTPPANVTSLAASGITATKITLTWVNPVDADYAGVMIRRAAGAVAPADASAGTLVADAVKPAVTVDATGLTTGTEYTFAAFAYDGTGNHATGASVTATTS